MAAFNPNATGPSGGRTAYEEDHDGILASIGLLRRQYGQMQRALSSQAAGLTAQIAAIPPPSSGGGGSISGTVGGDLSGTYPDLITVVGLQGYGIDPSAPADAYPLVWDAGASLWTPKLLPLAGGGTNAALTASNGGIVYSTASALAILAGTATARRMLQSGATAAPSWSSSTWPASATQGDLLYASSSDVWASLARNVTSHRYLQGGTVPSWAQVDLTDGVTGALPVSNGGTGLSAMTTAYAILAGGITTTAALQQLAIGSSGQILRSGGAGALASWSTATYPATAGTANNVLTSDGTNFVSTVWATGLPAASGAGKMVYDTGSAYAATAAPTTGQTLRANGTTPAWNSTLLNDGTNVNIASKLGIGSSTPLAALYVDANALTVSLGANVPALVIDSQAGNARVQLNDSGATPFSDLQLRGSAGTEASPTALPSGQALGNISFGGYGTSWQNASARISALAGELWSGSTRASIIKFSVTPLSSTTLSEAMRIDTTGYVGIGTTTPKTDLSVSGGVSVRNQSKATYTATVNDSVVYVGRNATPPVITLPAANAAGSGMSQILRVIVTGTSGSVTVQRAGSDTITTTAGTTGATSVSIGTDIVTEFISDGVSVWNVK